MIRHQVFSESAELEEIAEDPISVSRIKHKAVVEVLRLVSLLLSNFQVTKEGTEGAAATGVEIELFSASFGDQKDVTVDRPFIFVVQDRRNDVPVLVGKVTNPTMI